MEAPGPIVAGEITRRSRPQRAERRTADRAEFIREQALLSDADSRFNRATLAPYTNDTWQSFHPGNPRLGIVPLVDWQTTKNGKSTFKVVGFAVFWLDSCSNSVVMGRFVRIELPGPQRTLTLAEVEVFSDGRNVARQGKASQLNTVHGGEASKAIDGNKSGTYGDGGQTHSAEDTDSPWWEVDLGAELPVESIVIYNRTDGDLGKRLNGFTLRVLDKDRKVVFEKTKQPATTESKTNLTLGPRNGDRRYAQLIDVNIYYVEDFDFRAYFAASSRAARGMAGKKGGPPA